MISRTAPLLFVLAAAAAQAEGLHQVEILIFAQPPDEAAGEVLPGAVAETLEDTTPVIDFANYPCLAVDADPLAPPELRTREDLERCLAGYLRLNELGELMVQDRLLLSQSTFFRILHHSAWQQPVPPPARARPVRVSLLGPDNADTPEILSGTVTVSKQEYLEVEFDLRYRGPYASAEAVPAVLRKSQTVRSNQIYYLDDARIGILVRVTKVEAVRDAPPAS